MCCIILLSTWCVCNDVCTLRVCGGGVDASRDLNVRARMRRYSCVERARAVPRD